MLFSCSVVSDSLQSRGLQHTRLPSPSVPPGVCSNCVHWVCDAIQPSHPLSSPPTAFYLSLASGSFPVSWLFASGNQSVGASASASVPMNIWGWFPLYWLVWSPCCPRDSQESSPAPQFKSINSLALSLLYSPPLTSIHDYTHTKYQ